MRIDFKLTWNRGRIDFDFDNGVCSNAAVLPADPEESLAAQAPHPGVLPLYPKPKIQLVGSFCSYSISMDGAHKNHWLHKPHTQGYNP